MRAFTLLAAITIGVAATLPLPALAQLPAPAPADKLEPGDLAAHQQNLVSLFEVVRGHHQHLTSFSILIVLGALGFAVTDAFGHITRSRRIPLAVAGIGGELVIAISLYWNAELHNHILAQAVAMGPTPSGAPDVKGILASVGPADASLIRALHVSLGVIAGTVVVFIAPYRVALNEPDDAPNRRSM